MKRSEKQGTNAVRIRRQKYYKEYFMKKKMKGMLAVLFVLLAVFVVFLVLNTASCSKGGGIGGNDPKSLAKQT
jgi:uncharacterized integral membrane protein